jgi:hypothetical protein
MYVPELLALAVIFDGSNTEAVNPFGPVQEYVPEFDIPLRFVKEGLKSILPPVKHWSDPAFKLGLYTFKSSKLDVDEFPVQPVNPVKVTTHQ